MAITKEQIFDELKNILVEELEISEDDVKLLKTQMQNTISKDIPIETLKIPYNEAYKIFKEEWLVTAAKQLEYYAPPVIKINKID